MTDSTYNPSSLEIGEWKPTKWAVNNLIPESMITLIGATPTAGKSWFVEDLLVCISQGKRFANEFSTVKRECMLIDEDSPTDVLETRVGRLVKGHALNGENSPVNNTFIIHANTGFSFSDFDKVDWLIKWAEARDNPVIVIDSVSKTSGKMRLNHSTEATNLTSIWNAIKNTGATLIVIHHASLKKQIDLVVSGKEDPTSSILGNTHLISGCDSCLLLQKREAEDKDSTEIIVRPWSRRIKLPVDTFSLLIIEDKIKTWAKLVALEEKTVVPTDNAERILITFVDQDTPLTVRDILKHLAGRLSDAQVRDSVEELENHRVITRDVTAHNRFVYQFNKKIIGEYELTNSYLDKVQSIVKKVNPTFVENTTPKSDRRFSFN